MKKLGLALLLTMSCGVAFAGSDIARIPGNQIIYNQIPSAATNNVLPLSNFQGSKGTVYSYIASGTTGQSDTIEGSIDGVIWVTVATLTVGSGNASASSVNTHTWPFMRMSGTALLQVARGN